jgi:hypothetical protein
MKTLAYLLSGGFLKGSRTYILATLLAATGVVKFLTGDESMNDLLASLPEILGGLGLSALRAGVANHMADLQAAAGALQAFVNAQAAKAPLQPAAPPKA